MELFRVFGSVVIKDGQAAQTLSEVDSQAENTGRSLETMGERGVRAGQWLKDNWVKVGAAAAALGAGMESLARQQAPLTEQTRQLAASLDMQEDEVRDLARGMSDVTFPMNEVLDLMERGRQQGIMSAEQLKEYAEFWDMVGDATGEASVQLAESSAGLRAVGIAAGDEAEALDAFGFITRETSGDVGEFLYFLERTGPELREMGMGVDEAAAIMGALEHELGMTARTARQEFRQAVNEADGDINKLTEELGLSEEQLKQYTQTVGESSGVIQENAEIHADSYTMMQRVQHRLSELSYQYGDIIGMVGNFSMAMMAVGPIIKGVTSLKYLWTAATRAATIAVHGLRAAKMLLLGPIGLVIAAITAAVAIGWYLYNNWDDVVQRVTSLWRGFKETVIGLWDDITTLFKSGIDSILKWFDDLPGKVIARVEEMGDGVLGVFGGLFDRIVGNSIVPDMMEGIETSVGSGMENTEGIIKEGTDTWEKLFGEGAKKSVDAVGKEMERLSNVMRGPFADPMPSTSGSSRDRTFGDYIGHMGGTEGAASRDEFSDALDRAARDIAEEEGETISVGRSMAEQRISEGQTQIIQNNTFTNTKPEKPSESIKKTRRELEDYGAEM